MTDEVLVVNEDTGVKEVVRLGYILPSYDIYDTVSYKRDKVIIADIIGMEISVSMDEAGFVSTEVVYVMDNGDLVDEEEIDEVYEEEIEVDVGEFFVGDAVKFTRGVYSGVSIITDIYPDGRYRLQNGFIGEEKELLKDSTYKLGDKVMVYDGSDLISTPITGQRVENGVKLFLTKVGWLDGSAIQGMV